jgi:hypothetical protein
MAFGWILVAGAPRPAALGHALQDGSFDEQIHLLQLLPDLTEAFGGGAAGGTAGSFGRRHGFSIGQPFLAVFIQQDNNASHTFRCVRLTFRAPSVLS